MEGISLIRRSRILLVEINTAYELIKLIYFITIR